MKKLTLIILGLFLLQSCVISTDGIHFGFEKEGKGPLIEKQYTFQFQDIVQKNGIISEVISSTENKIVVTAPDDIMPYIMVEKKDAAVHIYVSSHANISTKKVHVKIYTNKIHQIDASSASVVRVKDSYTSEEFLIEASSGAAIYGQFEAITMKIKSSSGATIDIGILSKEADIESTSGSQISLSGVAKNTKIHASSGSSIDGYKLYSSESDIESTSGASIEISITNHVKAKASSGATIDVKRAGAHFNINKYETSGGEVRYI